MIQKQLSAYKGKRVLLLQGPLGPFFRRLAHDLEQAGAKVLKVNFNGGDCLFYPTGAIAFRGLIEEWPVFLERLLFKHRIDTVLLFGDCRPVHRVAHQVATWHGLDIGVFEEGYIRPDYITLEHHGANSHSLIPRSPLFYLNTPFSPAEPTLHVGNTFWHAALWAVLYYLAAAASWPWFRRYRHHRPLALREAWPWFRSFWRKGYYAVRERGVQAKLETDLSGRYFLVPLQVHCDAQIHAHSEFSSVEAFIRHVVSSFAAHAPADAHLVIKHHPLDRGYHDYSLPLRRLAQSIGIGQRVHYVHDQRLPRLLRHARGVVVVNSTVGLSALHHGVPLKVCGRAMYDMKGLTFLGPLREFWTQAETSPVDAELFQRFRNYLIGHTQMNGSFYRRLPIPGSRAGLCWGATPATGPRPAGMPAVRESWIASATFSPRTLPRARQPVE